MQNPTLIVVRLCLALSFTFLGNAADPKSNCSGALRANSTLAQQIVSDSWMVEAFQHSQIPTLFIKGRQRTLEEVQSGYAVSNEYDIFKAPSRLPQRDVFLGVGNNSSWDLALRSGANKLVLFDRSYEPLILQRFYFRAIFEISKSPLEFYKFALLMPISHDKKITNFRELDNYDFSLQKQKLNEAEILSVRQSQAKISEELKDRVRKESKDPDKEICIKVIEALHEAYLSGEEAPFPHTQLATLPDIVNAFRRRYFPQTTASLFQLAPEALEGLYNESPNFLSSSENYQRMRVLMLNAHFAQIPTAGPLWGIVANSFSGKVNGVSIYYSNILDANFQLVEAASDARQSSKDALTNIFREFPALPVFIETRGKMLNHEYEVSELK